jgi:hypothetical protein
MLHTNVININIFFFAAAPSLSVNIQAIIVASWAIQFTLMTHTIHAKVVRRTARFDTSCTSSYRTKLIWPAFWTLDAVYIISSGCGAFRTVSNTPAFIVRIKWWLEHKSLWAYAFKSFVSFQNTLLEWIRAIAFFTNPFDARFTQFTFQRISW